MRAETFRHAKIEQPKMHCMSSPEPPVVPLPSTAPVLILADDREAGSGVIEALRAIPEVQLQIKRLKVGDYLVDGDCVFERKTVADFAASVIDGRLFKQAYALGRFHDSAALILEGRAGDAAACSVRREALQGAMISLSLIFRLPVLRSLDPAETARLLLYAGRQLRRRDGENNWRGGRRPKGRHRRQLRVLQALPGIGPDRAVRLLETLGSVEAVFAASQERLEEIEGIGPKTASGIRDVLCENRSPYGIGWPQEMEL
jgi:DNA excision repair protein ERCC-4